MTRPDTLPGTHRIMAAIDTNVRTQMERNLRVLPWWWVPAPDSPALAARMRGSSSSAA